MPGVCITTSTSRSSVRTQPRHTTHHHWLSPTAATLLWTGVGGLPWGSQMKRPPWLASLCQSPLPRASVEACGSSVCPSTSQTRTCACQVDAHPCGSLFWVWTSGPHQNSLSSPQSTVCGVWCGSCAHTRPRCATTHTHRECHLTWVTAPIHVWQVVLPADQDSHTCCVSTCCVLVGLFVAKAKTLNTQTHVWCKTPRMPCPQRSTSSSKRQQRLWCIRPTATRHTM